MDRAVRLVQVELVEDDALDAPAPRPPLRPGTVARRWLTAAPRATWSVVAGIALACVVMWVVVPGLAAAARDARLARTVGLSVSLARPLGEAWRVPGTGVVGMADGAVLVALPADEGVAAVDLATGRQRYRLPGLCSLASGEEAQERGPHEEAGTADDLLMCVPAGHGPGSPFADPGRTTTVDVHEPASGELLRTLQVHGLGHPWVIGLDVVGLGADPDGRVVVERWSLATGEALWSYRSAQPVAPNRVAGWGSWRDGSTLHLTAGAWSVALDLATGRETGAPPDDAGGWHVTLADGSRVTVRLDPRGSPSSTVTGPDGRVRFTAAGEVVVPVVDDGTAAGSVLVTDSSLGELTALDAMTGRRLWSVPTGPAEVAVLWGSVLVRHGTGVTALDASTGEVRWDRARDLSDGTAWGMVTDGLRLLTVERTGQRAALVARHVDTGDPVWKRPLPGNADALFVTLTQLPDGTVMLHDGQEQLVALRP